MKLIVPLAGSRIELPPLTARRPHPLLHTAGDTILGHALNLLEGVEIDEAIFVLDDRPAQVQSWLHQHHPDLNVQSIVAEHTHGPVHALAQCADYLADKSEVLVLMAQGIVKADFDQVATAAGDGLLMVAQVDDPGLHQTVFLSEDGFINAIGDAAGRDSRFVFAGAFWLRQSRQLRDHVQAVAATGRYGLGDLFETMLRAGVRLQAGRVTDWEPCRTAPELLTANKRLLAVGYGTHEALERGMIEGFTVVPPVFVDESAEIDASIIGPYVSIGPNSRITRAVVQNSVIENGAIVDSVVIDAAIIGEHARVAGAARQVFAGDGEQIGF